MTPTVAKPPFSKRLLDQSRGSRGLCARHSQNFQRRIENEARRLPFQRARPTVCAGIGVLASVLVVPGVAVTVAMADSPTRVIETTSGPVRGLSSGVVNKFEGIRY